MYTAYFLYIYPKQEKKSQRNNPAGRNEKRRAGPLRNSTVKLRSQSMN